jgi:hypothetical protein
MDLTTVRKNLSSDNPNDVIPALKILNDKGSLSDLPEIMPHTKHKNIQRTAITTICAIIRKKLVADFNDLAPEMRTKLGSLLGTLNPEIVKELSNDIFSDETEQRLRAVQILGLLKKNPQIRTVLAKLVTDRDNKIRATAVNLLGKIIGPNDHEIILSLLNDSDKRVRANTVEALEGLGNKRMVPILQRFKKDPNNRIRGNVLKALYVLDTIDIEPDLLEMVATNDPFMIATSLWVITQTSLTSPVIEDTSGHCLLSENEMVADNARKALTAINTPRSRGYLTYLGDVNK